MSDELDNLRQLEALTEKLLKTIRKTIAQHESAANDEEEAQRRRRRFHTIAAVPLAATATTAAIRRIPASAALTTVAATTAVILLPHLDSGDSHNRNAPRVISPASPRPSTTPQRTKKPGSESPAPRIPSPAPPAPATSPAETTHIVPLVRSVTPSRPVVPLPVRPKPLVTVIRPGCPVDVRLPVGLRVCPRPS